MSLIVQYASSMINLKELQTITDPAVMLEKIKNYIVPILLISVLNLLFSTFIQYYVIYNPLNSDNNIFISAVRSLKHFIPYLILMVLLAFAGSIAIALGLVLLVVGAIFSVIYILTLYFFILPVLMVEGNNIANAITRTIKLAHKNFWSNIGLVSVFLIILIVISIMLSSMILLPFSGDLLNSIINPEAGAIDTIKITENPAYIFLSAAVSALTLPLMPIFSTIVYFNSRAREEQDQNVTPTEPEDGRVKVEDLYAKPYSDENIDPQENTEKPNIKVEDLYAKPYSDDNPDNPEKSK